MADEADRAQAHIEMMAAENIRSSKRPEGPQATGYCLYCDTPVMEGHRWCDSECRDAWAAEQGKRK